MTENEQLENTARELRHWQGTVDERLYQHAEHLAKINGSMNQVATTLARIETWIAVATRSDLDAQAHTDASRLNRRWLLGLAVTLALGGVGIILGVVK